MLKPRRLTRVRPHHGDSREVLKWFRSNYFDSVVTDPPYELGFMGKGWDSSGIAYDVGLWEEVLRVCKPGAFLFAFGGTRTYHRLTCAIEDAGWEVRDCLMWLYGIGFPKSLDVSKAIDKSAGVERKRIGRRLDVNGTPMGRDFENGKKHEGYQRPWRDCPAEEQNTAWLTAPASELAKEFDGYGTALKPAWEPIVVAMKPVDGTFANNAGKWGVAGLNIDGCRIQTSKQDQEYITERINGFNNVQSIGGNGKYRGGETMNRGENYDASKGRFPANLLLDETSAKMLDRESGISKSGVAVQRNGGGRRIGSLVYSHFNDGLSCPDIGYGDSGGASRFFYTTKAGKDQRMGTGHATVKPLDLMRWLCRLSRTPKGGHILDPFGGSGTTAIAAAQELRFCTIIEKDDKNYPDMIERLKKFQVLRWKD